MARWLSPCRLVPHLSLIAFLLLSFSASNTRQAQLKRATYSVELYGSCLALISLSVLCSLSGSCIFPGCLRLSSATKIARREVASQTSSQTSQRTKRLIRHRVFARWSFGRQRSTQASITLAARLPTPPMP
jgi:hypothetical protein